MPSALRRSRFPDGQSWLSLSRVSSAVEGGPGGSRMRELCELCRISGSTLLTNSSSKGQTSTHRRNEEQDFCLLPAGSIDAISMLTSAQETRNGSSPTGRMRRRDSEAPTENPTVLQSHLPKTKESAPRSPPSAPQAPFVKNPSQAKFLLRLSCRSLHFGLCFSPPSRSSNLPCLWKCLRRLRPPQTRPRHLPRRPHHLEKTGRSRKWRWKMRGVRSHLPQEQRKMLP